MRNFVCEPKHGVQLREVEVLDFNIDVLPEGVSVAVVSGSLSERLYMCVQKVVKLCAGNLRAFRASARHNQGQALTWGEFGNDICCIWRELLRLGIGRFGLA